MRIRSIRPEFWTSEDVAALDWHARLVFVGLWSYVDDNGVGRDVERLIVAALFPLDDDFTECSVRVHGALNRLQAGGQVTRYTVEGRPYLHVTAFDRHQVINRRSVGRYPLPTCGNAVIHGGLTEPSVSPHAKHPLGEGEKGRRGEGEKNPPTTSGGAGGTATTRAPRTPRSKAGTRIPEPFELTDDLREWAHREAPNAGPRDHDAFVDYWRGVPGAKGLKSDWPGTWRNWMRRASTEHATARPASRNTRPGPDERFRNTLDLARHFEPFPSDGEHAPQIGA